MTLPILPERIEQFITENELFEKTNSLMKSFLENWVEEDKEQFLEEFEADVSTVLATFKFTNEGISFGRDYLRELDYISTWIVISDSSNSYICTYTASFDYNLNCIDDEVGPGPRRRVRKSCLSAIEKKREVALKTLPILPERIEQFITENELFEKTNEFMKTFLENWVEEDKEQFFEEFETDIATLLATFKFTNAGIAFSRDYWRELDYISVRIDISDSSNNYVCTYTAFFDHNLDCIDDTVRLDPRRRVKN